MPVEIRVAHTDPTKASEAATAAFETISALNDIYSDYEYDSELSQLSRTENRDVPLSPNLWMILKRSLELAEQSQGAFDPTIGPLTSLWRKARREGSFPREDYLDRALGSSGYHLLTLNSNKQSARLATDRMRLDLGGIAKGAAIDAAGETLRAHNITRFLILAGGDMLAGEAAEGSDGWAVKLPEALGSAPLTNPEDIQTLSLQNQALATSGDLFQYVEIDGVRYSHIIDPESGLGLRIQRIVWVLSPDATTSDSLATTLSVLGPSKGKRLVEKHYPSADFLIVEQRDGVPARYPSNGWPDSKHF